MAYSFKDDFKRKILYSNSTLNRLIFVNVSIFILFGLIHMVFKLFLIDIDTFYKFYRFFTLPAEPLEVIKAPWTVISYMFMHALFLERGGLFHILFNMLFLFWFGKIFVQFQSNQKLLNTYFLGGISGALLFVIACQIFPMLAQDMPNGLVGASASVMAVIFAISTLTPNYTINLLFVGPVKLIYVALIFAIIDLLSLGGLNSGGHFAHVGGALYGILYTSQLRKGRDISVWFEKLIFNISNAFKNKPRQRKPKFKAYKGGGSPNNTTASKSKSSHEQSEIDAILEKISRSGYESLSEKEKDILFNASKK